MHFFDYILMQRYKEIKKTKKKMEKIKKNITFAA
jgi:hypothetical protein